MDLRLKSFPSEARKCFDFLATRFGFAGPDCAGEGIVGYASPPLWIWVMLEERNGTVDTSVSYDDGTCQVTVLVGQLMPVVGIGGFNPSPGSAKTRKGMINSMSRQAAVLREALPRMSGDAGRDLIARAAGGVDPGGSPTSIG
jgi:hypothetical protein